MIIKVTDGYWSNFWDMCLIIHLSYIYLPCIYLLTDQSIHLLIIHVFINLLSIHLLFWYCVVTIMPADDWASLNTTISANMMMANSDSNV